MPSWDQVGVPIHFHSSTISGSASWTIFRTRASIFPRQSPSSLIRSSINAEAFSTVTGLFMYSSNSCMARRRGVGRQRPVSIAHRNVSDESRGEVDGEAGVNPLLEPRRHRRKHQHHAQQPGPRELYPEVGGKAEAGESPPPPRAAPAR